MAYTHIATVTKGTANAGGTSNAIDTTGADLVVLIASWFGPVAPTVSDSKGNTWTSLTAASINSRSSKICYFRGGTVGTGHTFTLTRADSFPSMCVFAFSGSHTTPFDQQNGAASTSATTQQPGTITPSESGSLVITGLSTDPASVSSINGGFTESHVNYSSGNFMGVGGAYLIQTTAAAANPTWTATGSGTMAAVIASFLSATVADPLAVKTVSYRRRRDG